MNSRDNPTWLAELRGGGPAQQKALSELRAALLRGLRRALANWPSADDALLDDAAQEALIRILSHLDQFEGRSRFVSWATAIAIRVATSELRRRRWKDVSLDNALADTDLVPQRAIDHDPGPATHWQRREIVEKMYEIIQNELTEKQRAALLAELKGMPQDEIARQLGSNRNAIYKLTHDARKRLKRHLEAAGYEATSVQAAFANK